MYPTLQFFTRDLTIIIIFFVKELAGEFGGLFTCLIENTERYVTFLVPRERELTRIDGNGNEIATTISYTLQFTNRKML